LRHFLANSADVAQDFEVEFAEIIGGSKDPLYQWLMGDELLGRARRRTGAPSLSAEPWDD
jgi:hypothetical protein